MIKASALGVEPVVRHELEDLKDAFFASNPWRQSHLDRLGTRKGLAVLE
jgi:hypothetical protein